MPARALYKRLLEKCSGRVVRSDIGFAADPTSAGVDQTVEQEFVGMATTQEWTDWAAGQAAAKAAKLIAIDPLFIDYVLE